MTRLRCILLGCECEEHYPACHFCGADIYEDFIQFGKLEPLFQLGYRIRRMIRKLHRKRCEQCGRKFWHGYDDEFCSQECADEWLPF